MPGTTELNISGCEKFISLADEYLRGELSELSEEEKNFADNHINECKDCADYIEGEKNYLKAVKLAEYIPEISVSQSVMDEIIENRMVVNKPPKRRFVPVGFISAAAVVIIMFMIARGGPLNLFMKSAQDINSIENANDSGGTDKNIEMFGALYNENGINETNEIIAEEMEAAGGGNTFVRAFDAADADIAQSDGEAMPEVAGNLMPEDADDEAWFGVMNKVYLYYYIDAIDMTDEIRAAIIKDIEIYESYEESDIFDGEYKDTLENNLLENNIEILETLIIEHGRYIAVVYRSN